MKYFICRIQESCVVICIARDRWPLWEEMEYWETIKADNAKVVGECVGHGRMHT